MISRKIPELTTQELISLRKRHIIGAVIIGLFLGIATVYTVKNGIGFFTFFCLFFIFLIAKNNRYYKAVVMELKSRNLK